MVYESMLIFAVLFIFGGLFSILLQQRHALYLRDLLQDWLFLLLGLYFGWFWTHGGQTLAMKTWRIRLVARDGHRNLAPRAALLRFMAALLLVPTLLGILWALVDRDRQFLHDRLAGSLLIPAG